MCDPYSQIQSGQKHAINAKHSCLVRCKCKSSSLQQDFPPQTTSNTTVAIKLTNIKPCKLLLNIYSSSEVGAVHNTCSQSIWRRTWAVDWLTPTLMAPRAQMGRLPGRGTGRSMDGRHHSLFPSALRHESRQLGRTRNGVTPRQDADYFQWILPYSPLSQEAIRRDISPWVYLQRRISIPLWRIIAYCPSCSWYCFNF